MLIQMQGLRIKIKKLTKLSMIQGTQHFDVEQLYDLEIMFLRDALDVFSKQVSQMWTRKSVARDSTRSSKRRCMT